MHKTAKTLLLATLIAGSLDLALAIGFNAFRGVELHVVPQVIASGLIGMKSLQRRCRHRGSGRGFALRHDAGHCRGLLGGQPPPGLPGARPGGAMGPSLYVVVVYRVMSYVVLPLSRAPHYLPTTAWVIADLFSHLFFVGLLIALVVRRYAGK